MMHLLPLLAQQTPAVAATAEMVERDFHLTPGGWVTMLISVGFVTSLVSWCIYKVVHTPGPGEHLHSQVDIHTPDTDKD